jgi:hypothetical protein
MFLGLSIELVSCRPSDAHIFGKFVVLCSKQILMLTVSTKIDVIPLLFYVYGTCKTYPHEHTNGQIWYSCCAFYTVCAKNAVCEL